MAIPRLRDGATARMPQHGAALLGVGVAGATALGAVIARSPAVGLASSVVAVGAVTLLLLPLAGWLIAVLSLVAVLRGSTYGLAGGSSGATVYSVGSGMLGVPFVELVLVGAAVGLLLAARERSQAAGALGIELGLLCLLYATTVTVAVLSGLPLRAALDGAGGRLLLTVAGTFTLTSLAVRTVRELRSVILALTALGTGLACFGLVRYVFGGGDAANPYLLYSGLPTKLTFFELASSLLVSIPFFALLLAPRARDRALGGGRTSRRISAAVRIAVAVLAGAVVVLSMRRTNWLGLLIGIALVLLVQHRRWVRGGVIVVVTLAAISLLAPERLPTDAVSNASGERGDDSAVRFAELRLAGEAVVRDPLGQGPLGAYDGTPGPGWPAPPTIVHDAFFWIGLKLGVAGMALLAALVGHALLKVVRAGARAVSPGSPPGLAWSAVPLLGLGGFWLVAFLTGTPLLETRLAILFGAWLGLVGCLDRLVPRSQPQEVARG